MELSEQIHENAVLKKKIVKLEEKMTLKELQEKEKDAKIKDLGMSNIITVARGHVTTDVEV